MMDEVKVSRRKIPHEDYFDRFVIITTPQGRTVGGKYSEFVSKEGTMRLRPHTTGFYGLDGRLNMCLHPGKRDILPEMVSDISETTEESLISYCKSINENDERERVERERKYLENLRALTGEHNRRLL